MKEGRVKTNRIRAYALGVVFVSVLLGVAPFMARAAAGDVTSFEVTNQSSSTAGGSSDYTFTLELGNALSSGTQFYIFAQDATGDRFPDFSGFDFSTATLVTEGFSATSSGANPHGLQLTADISDTEQTYTFHLNGVTNSSTEDCYFFFTTTDDPSDPESAEFTLTSQVPIGDESCEPSDDDGSIGDVTSFEVTSQSSSTPGDSSDYTFTLGLESTFSSGTRFYIFAQNADGQTLPQFSGFDFSTATLVTEGFSATNGGENPHVMDLTADISGAAQTYTFHLNGITNSNTEACYFFFTTTDNPDDPDTAEFTLTSQVPIGDMNCQFSNSGSSIATPFGTNIGLQWDAVPDADLYSIGYSENNIELYGASFRGEGLTHVRTPNTSNIISGLDENTQYNIVMQASSNDSVLMTERFTATTGRSIGETRFNKPRIPKKKIKKREVTVKWDPAPAQQYVRRYTLQLKKRYSGKVVRLFKRMGKTRTQRYIKKRFLKSGKWYKVRMRAYYVTGEMTRYSPYKAFRTKK